MSEPIPEQTYDPTTMQETPETDPKGGELPRLVFTASFSFNGLPLSGVDVVVDDLPAYPETLVSIMAQAAGMMLARSADTGRAWEAFRAQARADTVKAMAEAGAAGDVVPEADVPATPLDPDGAHTCDDAGRGVCTGCDGGEG